MDEDLISKCCKITGKYLILSSFAILAVSFIFPSAFFERNGSAIDEMRAAHLWLFALGGIGMGCIFRWLGSFIEPRKPKDP